MFRKFYVGLLAGLLSLGLFGCGPRLNLDKVALDSTAKGRDVRILRDKWGVPHIFGNTDADTAFGLAYAHAEDDFATLEECLLMGRGKLASEKGADLAPIDYAVALFKVWEKVAANYEKDLSPETRRLCEAYAEGVNYYAVLHPGKVTRPDVFPETGKDVVVGFMLKAPMFFGLDGVIRGLMNDTPKPPAPPKVTRTASAARDFFMRGAEEIGSNMVAVAAGRSAESG